MAKKQGPGTALINFEEEFAKSAKQAVADAKHNIGGGNYFSTKAGVLVFNGAKCPGNTVAAIIVGSVDTNTFYEGSFDPSNPTGPCCWAIGHGGDLTPGVEHPINERCKGCPNAEFGSAKDANGAARKGKACKNGVRLALVPAGTFSADGRFEPHSLEQLKDAEIAMLTVPPTSCRAWGALVQEVSQGFSRPPLGVVTRIHVEADPVVQFRLEFSVVGKIDTKLNALAFELAEKAKPMLEAPFPDYNPPAARPAQPARKAKTKY